ncbi:type VI secretion system baseplate subunit TssE [Burkholderia cepacia]|uniref:type VI secretion system baseplate subunit TssE n=1 Tax=Burkholderia cepacia TaxID=292 RepID=UPI00158ADB0E|nr:type VI secretion system baseplate subunit TssE [Burkholderia cepacia]
MDDPRTRDGREGNLRDRLQPALLDRLTDDTPQRASEAPGAQWIGTERLRAAVLRDLAWLLNTRNAEDGFVDWPAFAHAQASVLNYGMRPLVGKPMSGVERMSVEASIRDAIVRFEPRIASDSIDVRSVTDAPGGRAGERRHNVLLFEIRGTLWSIPHPLEFVLRSDLDLDTGAMSLQSVAGA